MSTSLKTVPFNKILKQSELIERLKSDKNLDKDREKMLMFISFANMFEGDLENNLRLTSLELDSKYSTSNPSGWLSFLKHNIVKNYIDSYLEEEAEKKAKIVLATTGGGAGDALRTTKAIEEKRKSRDNSNIVVVFMPQKNYVTKV